MNTCTRWHQKTAGLLVPVFALRGTDSLGIGDTAAVKDGIDFCSRLGLKKLQVLPINELGFDFAPYGSISSAALDWLSLHMSPKDLPGLTQSMLEQSASLTKASQAGKDVDYRLVYQLKLDLLRGAFANFSKSASSCQRGELARFKKLNRSWLPQYTLFRVLMEKHQNADWSQWPAEVRSYALAQEWANRQPPREMLSARRFWSYVQWVADRQWCQVKAYADSKKVELIGDIPYGVSLLSMDTWAWPNLFMPDWSGGAPPEHFFRGDDFIRLKGQNWGVGVYDWEAHKRSHYSWWVRRIKRTCRFFHAFRFDHVIGIFRVYAFPWKPQRNSEFTYLTDEEIRAKTGGRVPMFVPRDDKEAADALKNEREGGNRLRIFSAAAQRCGSSFIAEDLGVVPKYVPGVLQKLCIPGFHIPHWNRDANNEYKRADDIPTTAVAAWNTHDHPPLATMYGDMVKRWQGPDGQEGWLEMQRLMRFLGLDDKNPPSELTRAVRDAFWSSLLNTPASLAVLIISDVLGNSDRFNQPGGNHANWTKSLDRPLTQYLNDPAYRPSLDRLAELIRASGR